MTSANFTPTRRSLLAGAAGGAAVLLLPGCASTGGFSMVEAVRRLLLLASENAFARLGMWRRLSRCYEQTALGAQTWMEVACVAYLCGRLRVEPT